MLGRTSFRDCIAGQLEKKRFGPKRTREVLDRFEGLSDFYTREGHADPESLALYDVLAEYGQAQKDKLRRLNNRLAKTAEFVDRFDDFDKNTAIFKSGTNEKATPADVVKAFIDADPRSKAGISYAVHKDNIRGLLWSMGGDVIEKFGKGTLGRQRGKAHETNVVRELFGEDSGDLAAKEIAAGYKAISDVIPDLVNQAGGSMRKLDRFILPQAQSSYKLRAAGLERWSSDMERLLDWKAMRWPNGAPIEAGRHREILENVFETIRSNGVSKMDPTKFGGQGASVGNMLEQHRFLVFKDSASWAEMHASYGEGNLFDVMVGHVDQMSHTIAITRVFGDNPTSGFATLKAMAIKRAQEIDAKNTGPSTERTMQSRTEAQIKNTVEPMFEVATRQNPMDPDSVGGAIVATTANLLTAAQLGSAALLAIPGDFATAAAVRSMNGMNPFAGVAFYFKSLADTKFAREIAQQTGFVSDEAISSSYAAQRFTGINTLGPAWSRRLTDMTLRSTLLTGHTKAARLTVSNEFMGLMARSAATPFDDLPFKGVLERYGISAKDWTEFSAISHIEPRPGVKLASAVQAHKAGRADLFEKFQGMITAESRYMIPESRIEAAAILKGSDRPDTLRGALLHSFSMYKNFPVTMIQIYGRMAMANPERATRLKFLAGLGASMTLMGAMGLQFREISKGRDPLPMVDKDGYPDVTFMGKAMLSGGALSIYGDFLTSGVNRFGGGPAETFAGPLAGFLGDTTNLAFGDVFQWADKVGTLGDRKQSTTPQKAAAYLARYTPGSSIWWARAAIQRNVFDALEELADPKVYQKRRMRERKQLRDNGNASYWKAGDALPSRFPELSEPRQ